MFSSALLLVYALSTCHSAAYDAEFIFPTNPLHNHGSGIVETPDGDLLACWFHGSGERKSDDVMIQGARKRKGETTWSEPFVMADTPNLPDCNPTVFIDPRGILWLFWITVQDNEWGGSLLKYRTATSYVKDGPPDWEWQDVIHCRIQDLELRFTAAVTEAQEQYADILANNTQLRAEIEQVKEHVKQKLPTRLGWMTRLHPIMTSENRIMLGLYSDVWNCSAAAFTEDWGQTWQFSEPIISYELGNIQPAFVRKSEGGIVAYMRDNGFPNKIRTATSTDGGVHWTPVQSMDIPNPGSSVECIRLENGHWVMVCNDQTQGRHRLTVYLSTDEGVTWPSKRSLEDVEPGKGSFSYPSAIQARDGSIHCTYSHSIGEGSTIKHARFDEEWLAGGEE